MPDRILRVLQVVHQFLPRYVGGTEQYTARVAQGLLERGHAVTVFAGGDAHAAGEWQGVPVVTVPGGLRGPNGALTTFRAAFVNPETEARFAALLDAFRPSVVHVQHLLGLSPRLPALAALRGVPVVATLHDYWFECANGQLVTERGALCDGPVAGVNCAVCGAYRLHAPPLLAAAPVLAPLFLARNRRIRAGLEHAAILMAPSDFLARRALGAGIPARLLRRVRFGIPHQPVGDHNAQRPPTADAFRISYVGSLAPRKGVHILLDAFTRLTAPHAHLTIAGPLDDFPAYVRELQRAARDVPRVTFTGRLTASEVAGLLRETDVMVAPSLWYENAPLVIAEAFAAGVPVVASRAGALAELVTDGVDGRHFRMGDAADLARVLGELAADPAQMARLRGGIQPPPTLDDHLTALLEIYREALGSG